MKRCKTCGCEIVYGVNGCMMLDDCNKCHGPVHYPAPIEIDPFEYATCDDLDALEDRCLDDAWALG